MWLKRRRHTFLQNHHSINAKTHAPTQPTSVCNEEAGCIATVRAYVKGMTGTVTSRLETNSRVFGVGKLLPNGSKCFSRG